MPARVRRRLSSRLNAYAAIDASTMPITKPKMASCFGLGDTSTAVVAVWTCSAPLAARLASSWLILLARFAAWMMVEVLGELEAAPLPLVAVEERAFHGSWQA